MSGSLWLVKSNEAGNTVLPSERYGPLHPEIRCTWKGWNNNAQSGDLVPEIAWPTRCKYRLPSWLCHGVRPHRAMPRVLSVAIDAADVTVGVPQPTLIGPTFDCESADPGVADPATAAYASDPSSEPNLSWVFDSDVGYAVGPADPLDYGIDEFVLNAKAVFKKSAKDFWTLAEGPKDYDGLTLLPSTPIKAFLISDEVELGTAAATRYVVLAPTVPPTFCPGNAQLPHTNDWPFTNPPDLQFPLDGIRIDVDIQPHLIGADTGFSLLRVSGSAFTSPGYVGWQTQGIAAVDDIRVFAIMTNPQTFVNIDLIGEQTHYHIIWKPEGTKRRVEWWRGSDLLHTTLQNNAFAECDNGYSYATNGVFFPDIDNLRISQLNP